MALFAAKGGGKESKKRGTAQSSKSAEGKMKVKTGGKGAKMELKDDKDDKDAKGMSKKKEKMEKKGDEQKIKRKGENGLQKKRVQRPPSPPTSGYTSGYIVPSDSVDLSPSEVRSLRASLSSILSTPISSVSDSDRKKAFNLLRTILLSPTSGRTSPSTLRKVVKLFNRSTGPPRLPQSVLVVNFQKSMSLIRLFDHSSVLSPPEVSDVVECYLTVCRSMRSAGRWKDCLNLVAQFEKEAVGDLLKGG
ncbi:hypothetical protein TrRE_jg5761, partial [Triparma retinervis]